MMKKILKILSIVFPILLIGGVVTYYILQLPNDSKLEKYNEDLAYAQTFETNKEYAKAINKYNDAVELIPSKKEAYLGIVKLLGIKNQVSLITDILNNSVSKVDSSGQSELFVVLGNTYLSVNNITDSINAFEKAKSLDNNNEDAKIGLAKAYLKNSDYEKAKSVLDINSDSQKYETAYTLKLLFSYSDLEGIKGILETAITPADEINKKIVEDYTSVSKQEATETVYINTLISRIYINNGYPKLAIKLLESIKDKISEYQDGMLFLAKAYFDDGNIDKCIETLKDYPNISGNYLAYLLFARSYVNKGDMTLAMKYYSSAISSGGDKAEEIYREYVNYLLAQQQYVKAGETLAEAGKKYKDAWVDIDNMKMYIAQKNSSKVDFYISKLKSRTDLTDEEKREYMSLAIQYYIDNQKFTEASMMLVDLKNIDINNPWYHYLYGALLLSQTSNEEAKVSLEKAIDLDLKGDILENTKKLLNRIN